MDSTPALRRIEEDRTPTGDQVEQVGLGLMRLDEAMDQPKDHSGLSAEDLNLDLGPLGTLLSNATP